MPPSGVPKPTAKKNSTRQTHCGVRPPDSNRSVTTRIKREFVSATLPSLELRLAAIHAKIPT